MSTGQLEQSDPTPPLLELRGLTKRFGALVANDAIDLTLRRGEIVALLGENGAGKSTLMNMLYGLVRPDAGEILIDGRPVVLPTAAAAIAHGVGMVHQHFMLVGAMTLADNILLNCEPTRRGLRDRRAANQIVSDLARQHHLDVDPEVLARDADVGMQQRAEILKALHRDARILVLDEPSAVLTPQETTELFGVLRSLAAGGTGVIIITHKLGEVLDVSDRCTVLRAGRVAGNVRTADATADSLTSLMIGRDLEPRTRRERSAPGPVVLRVDTLRVADSRRVDVVKDVSLDVRAGEIVGVAGVAGNGQNELVEVITGIRKLIAGHVSVNGRDLTGRSARVVYEAGVGHVPEDRHRDGLVLDFSIAENLALRDYYRPPCTRHGLLDTDAIDERATDYIARYDVRGGTPDTPAGSLSGGNQQKVVLAREIERAPDLLVASQPTRGLDVGAIEFVHRRITECRDAGGAVLLVSTELDEIMALADRIVVLHDGHVALVAERDALSTFEIGLAMIGGTTDADDA